MENRLLLDRYRLLGLIGQGGMGQVWRARDELLDRLVAVKTLQVDSADPSAAERFRREALTTAGLTHPNIVTVFDTGVDSATAFLVMELLPGPSLEAKLASNGQLPFDEILLVGQQVTSALAAAHAGGVVHRDIKPSNIAYADDGQIRVLDFGVAHLVESTTGVTQLTQASTVIGTAAYLSPEQASGVNVDARSDLYSLGCVLFTLLTGRPPFIGETPLVVCSQHVHAQPPEAATLRADAPPDLARLIDELLAKHPGERPADASIVHDRLSAIPSTGVGVATATLPMTRTAPLPSPTPSSVEPSAGPRVGGRLSPRRGLVALVALAVILALALLIAFTGGTHNSGGHPSTQPTHRPSSSTSSSSAITTTTTAVPAPTPAQAAAGFAAAVSRAAAAGVLTPQAAQDLNNRMTDLTKTLTAGHAKDGGHKVADLAHHLSDLARSGQLSAAGQQILAGPLATLEAVLPPQP